MAAESLFHHKDLLIILGTAGVIIPLLRRVGVSTILGFLLTGLVLGPHIMGRLATYVPALAPLTLANSDGYGGLAELGVVFLLFLIGLELSPERLMTMRRLVFGLGSLQVVITSALIAVLAFMLGYSALQSSILGMALSLSSTAIIIQLYSDTKRLGSQAGRLSFAVLLFQDLAVIPMLLFVATLNAGDTSNVWMNVIWALGQAAAAAAAIVIAGRYALTPLLRLVASAQSPDLFMAAVLFITLAAGALATSAGLSMSLGAFITGLMLAETEYRRAIEATIEPFKGLLLGLFFLLVGLNLNLALLLQTPGTILAFTALLIIGKTVLFAVIARFMALQRLPSWEAGLLLGPGGEFAFVLLAAAITVGVFDTATVQPILLVVTLSMIILPLLSKLASHWRDKLKARPSLDPAWDKLSANHANPAIIVAGFGRVGTLIGAMLKEQNLDFIAIDLDQKNISVAARTGQKVYFGDATNRLFLQNCGIAEAKALAITMDNPLRAEEILKIARSENPNLKIVVRARDERHAIKLYEAGATEAVPEAIEASLHLAEALLVETGVPMGLAIAAVHERREQYRKLLGQPNRRQQLATLRKRRNLPGKS